MTARALHEHGHDVYLFCQKGSPLADWTMDDSFPVNRSMNLNRFDPSVIFRDLARIRKTIREFDPDLLNPHCPPGHTYLTLARFPERTSVPLVRTVAEPRAPKQNIANRYLHEQKTAGLIFTTRTSENRYRKSFDLKGLHLRTISPGFHSDRFTRNVQPAPLRHELKLSEDTVLFGVVARMSPEKGQEILVEALTLLDPEVRDRCHFLLTGDDSRERRAADLISLAEKHRVADLLTFMPRYADVRPALAALDVGLITSVRSEAVCRIALEYMSFSKPVVSSDVNILPEVVVNGRNGWNYRFNNPAELAVCLREAVLQPELRSQYGQTGAQMVRGEFSMETSYQQTLDFYSKVIEAS